MDIAVIGGGNIGSIYAGNLARAGEQVTVVDIWREHVDRIAKEGLHLDGLHGEFTVRLGATTDPRTAPKADIAVLCVNTYATRDAAESAKVLLKDSGFVVTLQNGLGNLEILTEVLGKERVVGGLIFHSADLRGPGRVTHTNEGTTYLGELDRSRSERVIALHDALERAEMKPLIVDNILSVIWGKFIHNCGINAICAITDLRPGHFQEVPAVDEFQAHVINEALALAKAEGIKLPEESPLEKIKAYSAKKFHRPSMVQHIARGSRTEIDALNGYVARESKKHGLAAPYNDALTMLIKGLEHARVNLNEEASEPVLSGHKQAAGD